MKIRNLLLVLAFVGSALPNSPEPLATARSNWDRVQSIEPGKRVRITLKGTQLWHGEFVVKGLFASSTEDTVSLIRSDGATATIERAAVRKLAVRIPYYRRPVPLVLTGVGVGVAQMFVRMGDNIILGGDNVPLGIANLRAVMIVVVPTWVISTLAMPNKVIYKAPRP